MARVIVSFDVARPGGTAANLFTRLKLLSHLIGLMSTSSGQPGPAAGDRIFLSRFAARAAVITPIVVLAWCFGGVQATHSRWLFAGLLVALLIYLLTAIGRRQRPAPLPWTLLPLTLAVLLGVCQLAPLPQQLRGRLAPRNQLLWQTLLPTNSGFHDADHDADHDDDSDADLGAADDRELQFARTLGTVPLPPRHRVSLNPASTANDLALLAAAVAAFFLASQFFNRSPALIGLFSISALHGVALAFFGIAQQLRWNGLLFGSIELSEGGAPFASFVNRNSGAGYLNMCFAAAVAATVWAFSRSPDSGSLLDWFFSQRSEDRDGDRRSLPSGGLVGFLAQLNGLQLAAAAACVVIFAGIVCSLSRGGWLSMIGAMVVTVTAVSLIRRSWVRTLWLVPACVLGFALVGWVGRLDSVEQRLTSLWKAGPPDSRWAHWQNGLHAASDFTPLGSGLGTYRFVYRMYEQSPSQSWFYHAENQYLEALVEGGVPGLVFMLLSIVLVLAACRRLLRQPVTSASFACGVGGTFAIASQVIHAGFDFGLYMPANMALLAVISGGVCGLAARIKRRSSGRQRIGGRRTRSSVVSAVSAALDRRMPRDSGNLAALLAMSLAAAVFVGGIVMHNTASVESAMRASRVAYEPDGLTIAELDELIDRLTSASVVLPDNAEVHQRLGQLWIYRYRLEALAGLRESPDQLEDESLWAWTSTVNLHRKANEFLRTERHNLNRLRQARDVRTNLANAARALLAARRSCPLLSKPHLLLGEIGLVVSEQGGGDSSSSVGRAVALSVGDFDTLLECGVVEAQSGRVEQAWHIWRRAIEVLPERYERVLTLAAAYQAESQRLDSLLPDRPELMLLACREYFSDAAAAESQRSLAGRASQLLAAAGSATPDEDALRGEAFGLLGDHRSAAASYSMALQRQPATPAWRFELARQLRALGELDEAAQEVARCLRLDPGNESYAELQRVLIDQQLGVEAPCDRQNRSTDDETSANVPEPEAGGVVDLVSPNRLEN